MTLKSLTILLRSSYDRMTDSSWNYCSSCLEGFVVVQTNRFHLRYHPVFLDKARLIKASFEHSAGFWISKLNGMWGVWILNLLYGSNGIQLFSHFSCFAVEIKGLSCLVLLMMAQLKPNARSWRSRGGNEIRNGFFSTLADPILNEKTALARC